MINIYIHISHTCKYQPHHPGTTVTRKPRQHQHIGRHQLHQHRPMVPQAMQSRPTRGAATRNNVLPSMRRRRPHTPMIRTLHKGSIRLRWWLSCMCVCLLIPCPSYTTPKPRGSPCSQRADATAAATCGTIRGEDQRGILFVLVIITSATSQDGHDGCCGLCCLFECLSVLVVCV